ncbi:MAG: hypothetical protein [Cressdnaviricota sp.]|nr:MAG: hypothetical protein [Cressdnaviricota sp.]
MIYLSFSSQAAGLPPELPAAAAPCGRITNTGRRLGSRLPAPRQRAARLPAPCLGMTLRANEINVNYTPWIIGGLNDNKKKDKNIYLRIFKSEACTTGYRRRISRSWGTHLRLVFSSRNTGYLGTGSTDEIETLRLKSTRAGTIEAQGLIFHGDRIDP